MAFSTQQDFLRVEIPCPRIEGLKMKTYASTLDQRAWSLSKSKQSQYLVDLLTCKMTTSFNDDNGPNATSTPEGTRTQAAERGNLSNDNAGHGLKASCSPEESKKLTKMSSKQNLIPALGEDSVLNCALKGMTKMEQLLLEKENLKTQLDVSHEKLRILKEEKQCITAILHDEHQPEQACILEEKINQLRSSSKIDKNDENELKKILDSYYNREKAYKVLDAQNSYLRRLVEKLSLRSQLPNIGVEPEKSCDVNYLQCEVNNLRKEVKLLRSQEDGQLQKQTVSRGVQGPTDVENVAKIIAERNALREKCHHFAALEEKIMQWKHDSEQFEQFRAEACCALKRKDEEIQDYLDEIDELQHKVCQYEKSCKTKDQEADSYCTSIDCLKDENRQLREELCRADSDQKCIAKLQNQLHCLTDELCEKNCIIDQYDLQFQQLLCVVENLQKKNSVDIRGLQDVDSQTHNEEIEELAAATKATLNHISKELETKQVLENELRQSQSEFETATAKLTESQQENQRLKDCIEKTRRTCAAVRQICAEHKIDTSPGEDCTADVKRLGDLIAQLKSEKGTSGRTPYEPKGPGETSNEAGKPFSADQDDLQRQNEELSKMLKDCQNKIRAQEDQLRKALGTTDNIASELRSSRADLKEVGKLVNDISSVQDRNENLKSVLGAVDNCGELQKELDNLKKRLDEESRKNTQLADQNRKLQSEIETSKQNASQKQAELQKLQSENDTGKQGSNKNDTAKQGSNKNDTGKQGSNKNDAAKQGSNQNDTPKQGSNQNDTPKQGSNQKKDDPRKLQSEPEITKKDINQKQPEPQKSQSEPEITKQGLNQKEADPQKMKVKGEKMTPVVASPKARASSLAGRSSFPQGGAGVTVTSSKGALGDLAGRSSSVPLGGAAPAASGSRGANLAGKSASALPGAAATAGGKPKSSAKVAQLQKHYEKEIEGHRMTTQFMQKSMSKIAARIPTKTAIEMEREFRIVLDNFMEEICKWRNAKSRKLNKLQEICQKILDWGVESLTFKELVYLHQTIAEAAQCLMPKGAVSFGSMKRDLKCCKCSGEICSVPTIPKKHEKILLEKLAILERDIQSARETLRRLKQDQENPSMDTTEQSELDTLRASSAYRSRSGRRCIFQN